MVHDLHDLHVVIGNFFKWSSLSIFSIGVMGMSELHDGRDG